MGQPKHMMALIKLMEDTVVASVVAKYQERSALGIRKYGTTLDRSDLTLEQWITHVQEELMDATLYLERLKREVESIKIASSKDVI